MTIMLSEPIGHRDVTFACLTKCHFNNQPANTLATSSIFISAATLIFPSALCTL